MTGYAATQNYDLATGLGSVDAYVMASNWGARTATGPVITSLSPNPMTASSAIQTLTITGTGFLASAKVTASYSGFSMSLQVTSVSATRIQAVINTGATPRDWNITVSNPAGPVSFAASLNVVALLANPVVSSVTPNPLTGANTGQVLTINGSGFLPGTPLKVIVGDPGFTATLTGQQIAWINSTQILALVNVGVTARAWTVQVVNPNGLASNNGSLQVVAPPPPPVIASLTPNPMPRSSEAQTLTINGSGFQSGTGLHVVLSSTAPQTALQAASVTSTSATQIQVTVNVGNAARVWTVQVMNPNGTASNAATLTVK
jgi:hypothetical protein